MASPIACSVGPAAISGRVPVRAPSTPRAGPPPSASPSTEASAGRPPEARTLTHTPSVEAAPERAGNSALRPGGDEAAGEGSLGHAGVAGQVADRKWRAQVLECPGARRLQAA